MPSTDLRERMQRAGSGLEVPEPPVTTIVRRGRRRIAFRVVAGVMCVLVVGATIAWSIASLIALAPGNGAGPRTAGQPTPPSVKLTTTHLRHEPVAASSLDGVLYVLDLRGTLWKVDPKTLRTHALARGMRGASNLVGGGGYIWVWPSPRGGLLRLDPLTDARKTFNVRPASPVSYAYGLDSLWVLTDASRLLRIDPSTGHVQQTFTVPGNRYLNPSPQVAIAGGWAFVSGGGNGTVIFVDPSTGPQSQGTHELIYAPRASPQPGGPGNFAGASIKTLAASGPVIWSCCDTRDSVDAFHVHGGGDAEGVRPLPRCMLPWQPGDSMVAEPDQVWLFHAFSFCGPVGKWGPGDVFRIRSNFNDGLNYLPYPYLNALHFEGPVITGVKSGSMMVAGGRVWILSQSPNELISFPTNVALPTFGAGPPRAWWERWGWVLVALTALILVVGLLLRLRRQSELTAR